MEIQFKRGGQGWKEEEGFSAKGKGKTRSDLLFFLADEGALSGKQLSLLNYALTPLTKPKKVRGEIPQQGPVSYPLFNKAHFGGHSPSIEADRQTLLIM